jgi:hypothetical protein
MYAILQCTCENIRRAYKHKRILIFSDSQAALKVLSSPKVTSALVAEWLDALSALAKQNEVTLTVPGHCGIPGNENVINLLDKDQLCHCLVQSWLLEYPGVQQEKQLRTGLSANIMLPGKIHQVMDMANFVLVDHVREKLNMCLN